MGLNSERIIEEEEKLDSSSSLSMNILDKKRQKLLWNIVSPVKLSE